jgi:chitooligosaccharide deacetylase
MVVALAVVGLVLLAHTAPFPFLLDMTRPNQVMWRAPQSGGPPTVYLTFDDGPNPTATPQLLDVLARERVRATFFLIDRYLSDDTAPMVRRMFADGHGVALHSDTRELMIRSPAGLASWIDRTAARVEAVAGRRPCRAFRPHAGWRSAMMLSGLARVDYQLVGWGFNAWDWNWFRRRTADAVVRRIGSRARDGLIVVIHDGHHLNPRADREYAVEAAARLVPALRDRGFTFGSICDIVGWDDRQPPPATSPSPATSAPTTTRSFRDPSRLATSLPRRPRHRR